MRENGCTALVALWQAINFIPLKYEDLSKGGELVHMLDCELRSKVGTILYSFWINAGHLTLAAFANVILYQQRVQNLSVYLRFVPPPKQATLSLATMHRAMERIQVWLRKMQKRSLSRGQQSWVVPCPKPKPLDPSTLPTVPVLPSQVPKLPCSASFVPPTRVISFNSTAVVQKRSTQDTSTEERPSKIRRLTPQEPGNSGPNVGHKSTVDALRREDRSGNYSNRDRDVNREKESTVSPPRIAQFQPRGLQNFANNCFLNAAWQSICASALFRLNVLHWLRDNVANLSHVLLGMYTVMTFMAGEQTGVLNLRPLYTHLCTAMQWPNNVQQDAHECMLALFQLFPQVPMPQVAIISDPRASPLQLFTGQWITFVACPACNTITQEAKVFTHLSLPITRNRNTLEDCLVSFFASETITQEWRCSECNGDTAVQTMAPVVCPTLLLIQLKRFQNDGSKDNTRIAFAEQLDISPFLFPSIETTAQYQLLSIVQHEGTAQQGHYLSCIKTNQWYECNDSAITPLTLESVAMRQAYLLVYQRVHA
jgi:hypothetical protein